MSSVPNDLAGSGVQGDRLKFQPDTLDGVNAISRLEASRIWVHQTPFESSLLVPWVGTVAPWAAWQTSDLRPEHFEQMLAFKPELVILGSGAKLSFVSPAQYRVLIEHRIGIETMDTAAACRTYNVLVNEGRKVLGAFMVGKAPAEQDNQAS